MPPLCVFTPLPPCVPLWMHMSDLMDFTDQQQLSENDVQDAHNFYDELALDKRINELRTTPCFNAFVPDSCWYNVCVWRKDFMGDHYSLGCVQIDDIHLLSAGAAHIIEKFRRSLLRDTYVPFQYTLTAEDEDNEKLMHLLSRITNMLTLRQHSVVKQTVINPNVLNIVT